MPVLTSIVYPFYNLSALRKRLCKERLPESLHLVLFSKNLPLNERSLVVRLS